MFRGPWLAAAFPVLVACGGCEAPQVQPLPQDASVPDIGPGRTFETDAGEVRQAGTLHSLSVVVMQPVGEAPLLTVDEVRDKVAGAAEIARRIDSDGDFGCCLVLEPFVIETLETDRITELAPANDLQVMALIERQLATVVVVRSIGGCSREGGPALGCGSSAASRIVIAADAPPEAWLHELGHARGLTGEPDNGHRPADSPECGADADDVDERPVMCPRAPAGRKLDRRECEAVLTRGWPAPEMMGGLGASSGAAACGAAE
jgi:hypothetical protein